MSSLDEAVKEEPDRFVNYAFEENPDIKDLSDFRNALDKAFDTPRGEGARKNFDETIIVDLFESSACDRRLRENIGDKETDKLMGEVKRGEFELIQDGKAKIISTPKPFKIGSYTRNGIAVQPYSKSYKRWNNSEIKFIQVRKAKKLSNKEIIYQYNQHFSKTPRGSSSLKTKIWRIT
jgi:hypothetical protein